MLYLTGPYYHPNQEVRAARIHCINEVLLDLKNAGPVDIYCDIITNHAVATLNTDIRIEPIKKVLSLCDSVLVYLMPGWEKDENLQKIRQYADFLNIPVRLTPVYQRHLNEPYQRVWTMNNLISGGQTKKW